jgi:hypothetical protein
VLEAAVTQHQDSISRQFQAILAITTKLVMKIITFHNKILHFQIKQVIGLKKVKKKKLLTKWKTPLKK